MEAKSWLDRPALEWNPKDATETYWDVVSNNKQSSGSSPSGLSEFVECYHRDSPSDEQELICCMSYLSVSIVAASLARNLRTLLQDQVDRATASLYALNPVVLAADDDNLLPQVPSLAVAIAIPEGIILPLSVLAVHALNWPFTCGHELSISVAILPLDPTDAPGRLEHMIQVSNPFLILTASKVDAELMKRLSRKENVLNLQTLFSTVMQNTARARQKILDLSSQGIWNTGEHCHVREWIILCEQALFDLQDTSLDLSLTANRISHVVFTSGTTGVPKGCVASIQSLLHYIRVKNASHRITHCSTVLLASSVSFDPCLGDILATFTSKSTLVVPCRRHLVENLLHVLQYFSISHCLCTPTLWSTLSLVPNAGPKDLPNLQVIALGGEGIPLSMRNMWARERDADVVDDDNRQPPCSTNPRLYATYGVTEACIYQTIGEIFRPKSKHESDDVGLPFEGLRIRICNENSQESLEDAITNEEGRGIGEVVISGRQVDEWSTYLHHPGISSKKFVLDETGTICYRTGRFWQSFSLPKL